MSQEDKNLFFKEISRNSVREKNRYGDVMWQREKWYMN